MESEEFRRQREENKKRFRTMTFGQKLGFFKDYYLLRTVIIAGICAVAALLIWNFVRPQTKDILTVYVYDQYLGDDASIDVIICPRDQFESFAGNGYFLSLDDVLSDEEWNALSGQLFAAAGYQESDDDSFDGTAKGEKLDYGIDLGSSSVWQTYAASSDEDMIAGIVSTTKYRKNAVKFLGLIAGLS